MCGLVGMAGDLSFDLRKVMKELLFFNTLRGKDSTGVAAVARDRSVTIKKLTVPGYEYIEYPFVDNMMKSTDQIWIGHNRFKTMGDVSRFNAHPFEVLDEEDKITLVGAHNGTLNNKFDIETDLKEKFGTDSEALFNLLVEEETYKKAIGKLKGAWSLVWWDAPENTIFFCRNKERPLFYAFTKDRKVIIWASEAWMIQLASETT
jgi:glucosamine 6-phosphate synthetase-like amidotransferase/phosphosugar isomerase protein